MANIPLKVGKENANYKIFSLCNTPIFSLKREYFICFVE